MGGGAFLCVRMFAVSPRPLDDAQLGGFSSFAKGYKSTASGILGVDESWTITAN